MRATRLLMTMTLAATGVLPLGAAQAGALQSGPAVKCRGQVATIVGTPGPDTLRGTDGRDVMAGLGGDDHVAGGRGNDVICGGEGSDDLRGGRGDDRLYGGDDAYEFRKSSGGAQWFVLIGDLLVGGLGDDHLDAGYDTRHPEEQSEEPDAIWFRGRRGVDVRLAAVGHLGSATGQGHDVLVGQRNLSVSGSPGPDRIWGSPHADQLGGGDGDDVIRGRGGADGIGDSAGPDDDVFLGGSGRDTLTSAGGADVLDGGPDQDFLAGYNRHVAAMRGGLGNDEMYYTQVGNGCPRVAGGRGDLDAFWTVASDKKVDPVIRIVFDGAIQGCGALRGVERLQLDGGWNESWEVVGSDGPERVYAGESVPLVAHMRGGDDSVTGSEGDDFLVGGPGDDDVDGWTGTDTCRGFETVENCEVE